MRQVDLDLGFRRIPTSSYGAWSNDLRYVARRTKSTSDIHGYPFSPPIKIRIPKERMSSPLHRSENDRKAYLNSDSARCIDEFS